MDNGLALLDNTMRGMVHNLDWLVRIFDLCTFFTFSILFTSLLAYLHWTHPELCTLAWRIVQTFYFQLSENMVKYHSVTQGEPKAAKGLVKGKKSKGRVASLALRKDSVVDHGLVVPVVDSAESTPKEEKASLRRK